MIPYIILRRLVGTVVIWMVSAAVFFLMNVLPGDPAVAQLGLHADPAALDKFRDLHGLDRPLVVRYADLPGGIARMDLGKSYANNYPVAQLLKERLKPTAELGKVSATYAAQQSCPADCPFLGSGCFAEDGLTGGFITERLNWDLPEGITPEETAAEGAAAMRSPGSMEV